MVSLTERGPLTIPSRSEGEVQSKSPLPRRERSNQNPLFLGGRGPIRIPSPLKGEGKGEGESLS